MKKTRTQRDELGAWSRLIVVIEPLYPTSGRVGRQPIGVPKDAAHVLSPIVVGLPDEALEDALGDNKALRDFVASTCRANRP